MFRHLLLATDFSPPALHAAQTTMALARAMKSRVTLAHVASPELDEVQLEERRQGLAVLKEERFASVDEVDIELLVDARPDEGIAALAKERGADLVVAGRHGEHDLGERLLGTMTERLVRGAPASVLMVHPTQRKPLVLLEHVVTATDFSAGSLSAVRAAGAIAKSFDAWVTLLHVYDLLPAAMELLEEPYRKGEDHSLAKLALGKLEEIRKEHLDGVPAETKLERDKSVVAAICDYASLHPADLVVVGSHGRTGLARFFLGSVAERVVRHAPCSVLVMREPR